MPSPALRPAALRAPALRSAVLRSAVLLPLLPGLPAAALLARAGQRPLRAVTAAMGVALALAAAPAAAQVPPPGPGPGHMHPGGPMHAGTAKVTAQGEGRASVAPDLATVGLGVTTQAPTAAQAMADNAARQTQVIEALKAQGVAAEDLQTQGLSLYPVQTQAEGKPPTITGYQAQNIVSVRVRDLTRLGPLLDAMVAAGATDVQGVSFSREDDSAALDEARTAAVTDARRRAEVMAAAAGMALGPLVTLAEGGMQNGPVPMMAMARDSAYGGATPVETGQLQLTAQVVGTWMLVPPGGAGMPDMGGGPMRDMGKPGMDDMHRQMQQGRGGAAPDATPEAAPAPAGATPDASGTAPAPAN